MIVRLTNLKKNCAKHKVFSPTHATAPLSEDFASAIDPWARTLEISWRKAFGYWLDPWQWELLRRAFELFPAEHPKAGLLRFRQVVISLARQNGKTELAACASLFWLLWREKNEFMVGMAANSLQAKIIYDRVRKVIDANATLSKRMSKMTDTRGIQTKQGTNYVILANRESSAQGYSVGLGLLDELHTYKNESVFAAIVAGTGSRDNSCVLGITTAGDENSELLKDLYRQGMASLEDDETRFGFFCWEASEDRVPEDDQELLRLLKQSNPALASGRIDEINMLADVRVMPEHDIIRYRLNRFTTSSDTFLDLNAWAKCARPRGYEFPKEPGKFIISIDRTIDLGYASFVAAYKDETGITYVETVASLRKPSLEQMLEVTMRLRQLRPAKFVLDNYSLKDLGTELKKRGVNVELATNADQIAASSKFFALVVQQKLSHANDDLMTAQLQNARVKPVGEAWKIARKPGTDIDCVIAHALAIYFSESVALGSQELQLF